MRYGPHRSQVVELDEPVGAARATVLLLHGGYWRARHGLELMRPLVPSLVDAGLRVANVEYRRVGDGGGWPRTLEDVVAARDAVGGDPVVVVGHSAGAQLGICLAKRGGVRGVLSLSGVLDLRATAEQGLGEGAAEPFLGGSPEQVPEVYAAASPVELVPVGVPVTCLHGDADQRVPLEQAERFAALGGGRLVVVPGDHFAVVDPASAAWRVALAELAALL